MLYSAKTGLLCTLSAEDAQQKPNPIFTRPAKRRELQRAAAAVAKDILFGNGVAEGRHLFATACGPC